MIDFRYRQNDPVAGAAGIVAGLCVLSLLAVGLLINRLPERAKRKVPWVLVGLFLCAQIIKRL